MASAFCEAEPEVRAHPGERLMKVLDRLDEMRLADDDVQVVRLFDGHHFE